MKQEKEELLKWLKDEINTRVEHKFRKGDRDHKEDLMSLDLIQEIIWEQIDGLIYALCELKKQANGKGNLHQ